MIPITIPFQIGDHTKSSRTRATIAPTINPAVAPPQIALGPRLEKAINETIAIIDRIVHITSLI
jgi:hypothetical protein